MAQMMAHGTAVAALEASSEIWTLESNEPVGQGKRISVCATAIIDKPKYVHMVQTGAMKLNIKAKPFGQSYTAMFRSASSTSMDD